MLAVGQPVMRTVPALTTAAAMNGTALDRSGSMCQCRAATGPGRTCQRLGVAPASTSTSTPACRSIATVIAMCGADGSAGPTCCTIRPSVNDAPESSRPETNCDDAEASICTAPPATDPVPCTRNGRPSPSTSTPRPRSASSNGLIGRTRACSSPSKVTAATPSAASGGTKRNTVPARPQSIRVSGGGAIVPLTSSSSAGPSTRRPSASSASIIRSVSRLRSAPLIVETPPFAAASAESTNARLVWDFEPGTVTVAQTGRGAQRAVQVVTCSIIAYRAP